MGRIRRYFRFYGRVQGVGFRWRAYNAAGMNGVTGFVKNLYDGSVEMEAEGTEEAVDKTVIDIENGHFISIENMETRDIPLKNDSTFTID